MRVPGHADSDDLKSRFSTFRPICERCARVVRQARAAICYGLRSQPSKVAIIRHKPAFLASLLKKLLKVEVATSLGEIAGLLTFSLSRSNVAVNNSKTKAARVMLPVRPIKSLELL